MISEGILTIIKKERMKRTVSSSGCECSSLRMQFLELQQSHWNLAMTGIEGRMAERTGTKSGGH